MARRTTIHSNGVGKPQPIKALLEMLDKHPLDRAQFEGFFIEPASDDPSTIVFFGNFATYSHVFRVETSSPKMIARLTKAIEANQKRADYLSQPTFEDLRREREERWRRELAERQQQREADARRTLGIPA